MDYAYAVKALPQTEDPAAAARGAVPEEPEPQPPQEDDARPWAGDVYDEGDESDPAHAYAAFSGQSGEQAWLDKAEDGTLTGWVRDETGQVWRYSDPDAWAIDVDDSGMAQTGGSTGGEIDAEQQPADEVPDPSATAPDEGSDPSVTPPGEGLPLDFGTADEVVLEDDTEPEKPEGAEKAPDEEEDEEDEEDGKPWS
ncbi:hypothetical protein ACWDZ4_20525 [Streptomyces sp. NPDC003016]